jgi:hypothetical protein
LNLPANTPDLLLVLTDFVLDYHDPFEPMPLPISQEA